MVREAAVYVAEAGSDIAVEVADVGSDIDGEAVLPVQVIGE